MSTQKADWIAIEGAYRSGKGTLRDIAAANGITEGAIRARAKKLGWVRDPEGAKRERVRAIISGATQDITQYALRNIEDEAQQDVADMRLGLNVARLVLQRLSELANSSDDVRALKTIAESNKIAIDTIRRIRGLDDQTDAAVFTIERSYA